MDDEFGDLYGDLGVPEEVTAPVVSAPVPAAASSKSGFELEDDDDDDELYGSTTIRVAPSESNRESRIVISEEFSEDRAPQVRGDGSDSESDDDLQIVLNTDKRGRENEATTLTLSEVKEKIEDADVSNQTWAEDHQQQPAAQSDVSQPVMAMPPSLPPGLAPPVDHQATNPAMSNAILPRPPGKPFVLPQQHHAQYRYVRAPMAAGAPMMNPSPAGQQNAMGRGAPFPPGSWNPGKPGPLLSVGGQMQVRPPGGAPWSHGSEFHLPPTKTVFDMDLDALEDKPWRHPTVDITDYFNFGFNENSWKQYCQQLSQIRLESSMQSKINVYDGSRTEQPMMGRAIQVETGNGDRRPSHDVRRNRNRDSDAVIEIVLKDAVVDTPVPVSSRMDCGEEDIPKDQDGILVDPRIQMSRNGSFMETDGSYFPMGPRPRAPYRMFPGGAPFGGRGVLRPPYYDAGMPQMMHMRPEGFPIPGPTDFGDQSRSTPTPSNKNSKIEEEHSSGSVAVKDDRKEYKDGRRSKTNGRHSGSHGKNEDDDVLSDEQKRSTSADVYDKDDKYEQESKRHKRYSDSYSKSHKGKYAKDSPSDGDYSSYSDEEDYKSKHRNRKERGESGNPDKHSWQKKVSSSEEKEKRTEKDQRREDEWRRSQREKEKEEMRWKEEDARRRKGREEENPRRREDDSRKRERGVDDQQWQRKERDDSLRREREDSQTQRRRGEESYERRDREDERERSKRHGQDKAASSYQRDDEEYLRRKSSSNSSAKHDSSQWREYSNSKSQYEDDIYDRKASASAAPSSTAAAAATTSAAAAVERRSSERKEDERMYKDNKYASSGSRGKDLDSNNNNSRRSNGSNSEYHIDDRGERKKQKGDDYQRSSSSSSHAAAHAEKVLVSRA